MEKINKHNYEAFFLDYLEGNLAGEQEQELLSFLKDHPELRAELEEMMDVDLTDLQLPAVNVQLADKSSLKQGDTAIEERMIAAVEGLLSNKDQKALEAEIEEKGLQKTYLYYQNAVLKADQSKVYEDKAGLKRRDSVIIPMFYRYASAAAVALLLISLYFMDWNEQTPINNGVAEISETNEDGINPKSRIANIGEKNIGKGEATSDEQNISSDVNPVISNGNEDVADNKMETEVEASPKDSTKEIAPSNLKEIENIEIEGDPIVQESYKKDSVIAPNNLPIDEDDVVDNAQPNKSANQGNKKEQPFKLITDAAGGLLNREIFYEREKESGEEVVAHHFKLGNFEFQRKKH